MSGAGGAATTALASPKLRSVFPSMVATVFVHCSEAIVAFCVVCVVGVGGGKVGEWVGREGRVGEEGNRRLGDGWGGKELEIIDTVVCVFHVVHEDAPQSSTDLFSCGGDEIGLRCGDRVELDGARDGEQRGDEFALAVGAGELGEEVFGHRVHCAKDRRRQGRGVSLRAGLLLSPNELQNNENS